MRTSSSHGKSIYTVLITSFFALAALALPAAAQGSEDGDRSVLASLDSFRVYDEAGFSYDLATTGDDGQTSKMRVSVRVKGEEAALVRYSEPIKQRGQSVLVRGNAFWLFQPGMKNALRISPRQIIFGQASAGDISRISFGAMYSIDSRKEIGGAVEYRLKAKAGANATYDLVDLQADSDNKPMKALCRGKSGSLMKTIIYEKYETYNNRLILTEFSIVDEVNKKSERLRMSNFDAKIPPDSEFSVQALRFSK